MPPPTTPLEGFLYVLGRVGERCQQVQGRNWVQGFNSPTAYSMMLRNCIREARKQRRELSANPDN